MKFGELGHDSAAHLSERVREDAAVLGGYNVLVAKSWSTKLFRGLLWFVKGVLLAIALGALVIWSSSYRHVRAVVVSHLSQQPQRIDYFNASVGCMPGRIVVGRYRMALKGDPKLESGQRLVASHGLGWKWKLESEPIPQGISLTTSGLASSWGPFEWTIEGHQRPSLDWDSAVIAAPCWLVALTTAAWPATSIVLSVRRWRRQRNEPGNCRRCGYDLRATPQRCPECGEVPEGVN